MIGFLVFFLILGILIIVHEFGHFILAKMLKVKVEIFALGFGPSLWSRKRNQTQYKVCAIPLGGYIKMAGDNLEDYKGNPDEFLAQSRAKRFLIIFGGPFLNYVLGLLCLWLIFFAGYPTLTAKVGGLIDGFGAQQAGLRAGDKILAVDEKAVSTWEELQNIIQSKKETNKVLLSILRDNKEQKIAVNIKEKQIDDQIGGKLKIGLLGITPYYEEFISVRHGFFESFFLSLNRTWKLTAMTYNALARMITGKLSIRESVTGPLGILYITYKTASQGIIAILNLIAGLSVSLSIFNLLPLPILDGGHIFLLGIEKIRGKYLSLKSERIISNVGLSLIITIAILITYNDLMRFSDKIFKFFGR